MSDKLCQQTVVMNDRVFINKLPTKIDQSAHEDSAQL